MNRRQKRKKQLIKKILLGILILAGLGILGAALYVYIPQLLKLTAQSSSDTIISPNQVSSVSLNLQQALTRENILFDSIERATESAAIVVHLKSGGYVYFDSSMNYSSQAKLLGSLLSRISIEEKNKKVRYIDMRFEKAIVKFD